MSKLPKPSEIARETKILSIAESNKNVPKIRLLNLFVDFQVIKKTANKTPINKDKSPMMSNRFEFFMYWRYILTVLIY